MILHAGVLALLLGGLLAGACLVAGALIGLQVARRWDPASAGEQQLRLERRTFLVATLARLALAFVVLSLPLYVLTAEDLHPLFVGAMCATGTLNAAPFGWQVLAVKLLLFFLASLWLVLHHYDLQAEDLPLTRLKLLALPVLAPLALTDLVLMLLFYSRLRPEIVTSCCGSLFRSAQAGVAAETAAFPAPAMMPVFFSALALLVLAQLLALCSRQVRWRLLLAGIGLLFLPIALLSILSFISLYLYQLPSHHCPFDMLQAGYGHIGYPLYLGLFGGVLCALVPGLLQLVGARTSLAPLLAAATRRWALCSLLLLSLFWGIALWSLVSGPFTLFVGP